MGTILKTHPVKLISGVIASSTAFFSETEKKLTKSFGPIDYRSRIIDFDCTDYYLAEMGKDLKRRFFSFKKLIDPVKLSEIKLKTNKVELLFAKSTRARKRTVNIDPGYINDAKLVLASTKDYNHRLYIANGIYQEITLTFQSSSFRPFDWTYPDYRTDDYIVIFNHIRELFMNQRNI